MLIDHLARIYFCFTALTMLTYPRKMQIAACISGALHDVLGTTKQIFMELALSIVTGVQKTCILTGTRCRIMVKQCQFHFERFCIFLGVVITPTRIY